MMSVVFKVAYNLASATTELGSRYREGRGRGYARDRLRRTAPPAVVALGTN